MARVKRYSAFSCVLIWRVVTYLCGFYISGTIFRQISFFRTCFYGSCLSIYYKLEIDWNSKYAIMQMESLKRLHSAGRNKMALGFSPLMHYKCGGGGIMSDYELLSTVYMVISLVLVAIELGRNLGNQNKK